MTVSTSAVLDPHKSSHHTQSHSIYSGIHVVFKISTRFSGCFITGAIASGCLVLIAGYSLNVTVVVVCMSLAGMTTSLAFPAYTVNMLDIAPRYASIIMGICNTIGTTAGFVSPTVVGFITQHQVGTSQSPYRVLSYSFLGSPLENFSHEGRVEGRGRLFIPRSTQ